MFHGNDAHVDDHLHDWRMTLVLPFLLLEFLFLLVCNDHHTDLVTNRVFSLVFLSFRKFRF